MTSENRFHTRAHAVALAATVLLPSLAMAEGGPVAGTWKFGASMYGYLPTISMNTAFPVSGEGASLELDADTILDTLKMTFMGALDAHNGRWGAFTDVVYMDLGDSKSGVRDITIGNVGLPASATGKVDLDLKALIWTLAGEYRVAAAPTYTVDLLAGVRYLDIEQTLDWSITGDLGVIPEVNRAGSAKVSGDTWDGIVGVRSRFAFGEDGKWAVPLYLDVGTGESDLTWQGMVGVTYAFHWGDIVAAWRYLDFEFKDGALEDLSTNGPLVGVTFRW